MKNLCHLFVGLLLKICVFLLPAVDLKAQCPSDTIAYVNSSASGANDGSSWVNAFTDLQAALNCTSLKEIWVAQGSYSPSLDSNLMVPSDPRFSVFKMRNNLKIIGGFAGTETSVSQRIDILPTYLSRVHDPILTFQNSVNMIYNNEVLDESAVLDGFIIEGYNDYYSSFGSAIVNINASPSFRNIKIENASGYDGCIYNLNSDAKFSDIEVTLCGSSTNAAVFHNVNSNIEVRNCSFISNGSFLDGGVFYQIGGSLFVENCFIEQGNAGLRGGGIYGDNASITCINVAFSFCGSNEEGATIYLKNNSDLDLTNCTIHAGYSTNFLTTGGGVFAETGSIINIKNSIIWDNTGEVTIDNIANAAVSNSLIKGGFLGAYDFDPQFVLPQLSGTAHPDLRLRECSQAIDLGEDTDNPMFLDLDGNLRFFDAIPGGSLIDLGAYEKQINYISSSTRWYVDSSSLYSGSGRSWECSFKTLDEALDAANSGDSIFVKKGTYYATEQIINDTRSATFSLKAGVKIFGGFSGTESELGQRNIAINETILSGNGLSPGYPLDDSYHVIYSEGPAIDTNAVLDGFTIQGGGASSGYHDGRGSGIYVNNSSPKFRNLKLNGEFGIINGAVSFQNSNSIMENIIFENLAGTNNGGCIYLDTLTSIFIYNCQFIGDLNNPHLGNGGAIYNRAGYMHIDNSSFIRCKAQNGGAIYNGLTLQSMEMVNCGFIANEAINQGAAVYSENFIIIRTSTFTDNTAVSSSTVYSGNLNNLNIVNSILWSNNTINEINDTGAYVVHCIIEGGYFGQGFNIIELDPFFAIQPENGNLGDISLTECSYAVDAGLDFLIDYQTEDLYGNPRLFQSIPGGEMVDIGAVEYQLLSPVPIAQCKDLTLTFPGYDVVIYADSVDNNSYSGCGNIEFTFLDGLDSTFLTCDFGLVYPLVLVVTDDNGTTATCTSTITLIDTIPPVADCLTATFSVNAQGYKVMTRKTVDLASGDMCEISVVDINPDTLTCANLGLNLVTLIIEDLVGQRDTCTANITIVDSIAPVAICKNITINLDNSGSYVLNGSELNNNSTDNCNFFTYNVNQSNFNCTNLGQNNVVLTVSDSYNNTSTCNSIVTVSDIIQPMASCLNISVNLNGLGTASISAAQINDISSDNCGSINLSANPTSFNCSNIGNNNVVLTVTDASGNTSSCNSVVVVNDNLLPSAECKNITLNLKPNGTASITAAQINDNSSDNCGQVNLSANPTAFNCNNIGANNVILTVTDGSGNIGTCTATVTVVDNIPPVAVCQDITVNLNASGSATITPLQVNNGSSDNCGFGMDVSPSSFDCNNIGANTVTLSVTDSSLTPVTCTATVTVVDNIPPVAVCQDITVNLNASGSATITPLQINNGSSDNCGFGMDVSPGSFDCNNIGANTVTLSVTDSSLTPVTCTATVTVLDNIPPVAVCQDITINLNASGSATITPIQINNGSSDNCGFGMDVSPSSFDCNNIGANTVTLSVTDSSLTPVTCTATVTVLDNIPPVAVCQDITINLNASGSATITPIQINNGSSDNCGFGMDVSPSSFDCNNIGANTVTLSVTDSSLTPVTCTANVTVVDNIPPVAVCQDITVNLNASGSATITALQVNNGSSDNCGFGMDVSPSSFNCNNIGANTVTLSVTDSSLTPVTCTATVTVVDNIPPVAVCQDITVNLNASGSATITPLQVNNGSSDNCGFGMDVSPSSFNCNNIGANTVTLSVTDSSLTPVTCTATVTVDDNIPPVAVCQDITVNLNASGSAIITPIQINNGSSDNCGFGMDVSPNSFNCNNIGANTVTLSVTDSSLTPVTCTATVTVVDNIPPVAVCQDITVNLNPSGSVTITPLQVNNGSSDNCGFGMDVSPGSFNCNNIGANTVTLSVTDSSLTPVTCTATVTVVDNIPPVAVCQDITVNLNASGSVTITPLQINNGSSDNCGFGMDVSPGSFNCNNIGANTVTLSVTDSSLTPVTCTATVTVVDNIPPVAVCQDITVNLNASGSATITPIQINNGSSDNCGFGMDVSPNSFNCNNIGANTVTLSVTDSSLTPVTCTATVTVVDNIPPVAVCQDITVNLNASGSATITPLQVNNGSSDNCGFGMDVSPGSFNCNNIGANTVTLSVTDSSLTPVTCTATVTVVDNIPPVAVCQDVSLDLDNSGNAVLNPAQVDNGSSDACGIASLVLSNNTFNCSNSGSSTVLTVTDVNGNSSTCSAIISINDNVSPTALCQNISINLNALGESSINAAQINNNSSDNCGALNLSVNPQSFNCTNLGNNNVILTVTDGSGNSATCFAIVTVNDDISPIASCKNISLNLNVSGVASLAAAQINNNSSDNCGSVNLSANPTAFNCNNIGANSVILSITDGSGNIGTCTAIVTVVDNIPPVAVCQDITVNLNASGSVTITPIQINNGSSDNCGFGMDVSPGSFDCNNIGANTVTLSVTDSSLTPVTCTATVTVVDNILPVAVCQDITVNLNASGSATITALQINNGSSDNCGFGMDVSPGSFNCNNIGANTVTLSVTDSSLTPVTCTATVTVLDNILPVAVCQDITVNLNASGSATITPIQINNGSSDNCGFGMDVSPSSFDCNNIGANTVTLSVTDSSLTPVTCTATVTVVDNIPPVAVCQDITVNLNASGSATITPIQINNGSSDNCGFGMDVSPSSFNCNNIGANTVTLSVTDSSLTPVTCTATVTVVDNIPPVAVCQDITVNLNASGSATITPIQINNGSSDNCGFGMDVSPGSFNCNNIGANTVTLSVTDSSLTPVTCTATVTVVDNIPPVVVCKDITVNLNASGNVNIVANNLVLSSNDNCGIINLTTSVSSFNCSNIGNNMLTVTAKDLSNNMAICTSVVHVVDLVAPTAVCQNITVNITGPSLTIPASSIDNGSQDACGILSIQLNPNTFTCANAGSNSVVLSVTDLNGNVATCSATVTVTGDGSATAVCQNVSVNLNSNGLVTVDPALVFAGTGSGGCGSIADMSLSPDIFDCSDVGSNTAILTVTSTGGGTSTCSAIITISDVTLPTADCKNITINLNNAGNATISASALNNASNDACGLSGFTASITSFNCTHTGNNNVTLLVTDNNGNTNTCISVVTVKDLIKPTAICNFTNAPLGSNGSVTVSAAVVGNGSSDACGIQSYNLSQNTWNCSSTGVKTVTLTVTDNNSNTSTCNATIFVFDGTAPIISCPPSVTINNNAGSCNAVHNYVVNASDNCSFTSMMLSGLPSGASFPKGTTTMVWKATDASNNQSTCTFNVTVQLAADPAVYAAYTAIGETDVLMTSNKVFTGGVGNTTNAAKVRLRTNTQITAATTFVKSVTLDATGGSAVTTYFSGAASTSLLPVFPSFTNLCTNDITVAANTSQTLTGSCYDIITVKNNATLTFSGNALVNVRRLIVENNGKVLFAQNTTLRINNEFGMSDNSQFNNVNTKYVTVFSKVNMNLQKGVKMKAFVRTIGNFNTGNSNAGNPTILTGVFIGVKISGGTNTHWYRDENACFLPPPASSMTLPEVAILNRSSEELEVKIVPNPASESFSINVSNEEFSNGSYTIHDLNGRFISKGELLPSVNSNQVDIRNMAPGYYSIKVVIDGQTKNLSLVVID